MAGTFASGRNDRFSKFLSVAFRRSDLSNGPLHTSSAGNRVVAGKNTNQYWFRNTHFADHLYGEICKGLIHKGMRMR